MTAVYETSLEETINEVEGKYRGIEVQGIRQSTSTAGAGVEGRVTYSSGQDMSSENLRAMARNPSFLRLYERRI